MRSSVPEENRENDDEIPEEKNHEHPWKLLEQASTCWREVWIAWNE